MSGGDLLPSWNDGAARTAILGFVEAVTRPGPSYVAPADRIATFDNDGTLWCEKPQYVEAEFVFRRYPGPPAWFPATVMISNVPRSAVSGSPRRDDRAHQVSPKSLREHRCMAGRHLGSVRSSLNQGPGAGSPHAAAG